jgi:hypothetical protein
MMTPMRSRVAALAGCLALGVAARAHADGEPRIDSGFFGRFGLGYNVLRDLVAIELEGVEDESGVVVGKGISVQVDLGWVPTPGIAIGMYVVTDRAGSGDADFGEMDVLVSGSAYLDSVGLFLTYYPDPDGGWYMTGGAGVGTALSVRLDESSPLDPDAVNPDAANGFGAFFSSGYEWRLGRSWGLGACGRIQVINSEESEMAVTRHRSVGFAVLGALSFN